jgi:hypothetical protein
VRADSRLRAAHAALAVAFLAFGAVDGTWAARLPAIQDGLGLDSGQLGIVIFSFSIAATAALPLAAFAPGLRTLVLSACVLGAGIGLADISANAHGVTLEDRVGRPLLSGLHGSWSFGLLTGSGIAAVAAAAGAGPKVLFPAVAVGVAGVAVLVMLRLLPGAEGCSRSRHARPRRLSSASRASGRGARRSRPRSSGSLRQPRASPPAPGSPPSPPRGTPGVSSRAR